MSDANAENGAVEVKTADDRLLQSPYTELAGLGLLLFGYMLLVNMRALYGLPNEVRMGITNGFLLVGSLLYAQRIPLRQMIRPRVAILVQTEMLFLVLIFIRRMLFPDWAWTDPNASVLLVLLAPFAEEYFFRGILLDHLSTHINKTAAVCLVSLLFGWLHFYSVGQWIPMAVFSVILCLVTLRKKNLGYAIILHGLWNMIFV